MGKERGAVSPRHLFPKPGIRKPFPSTYPNFRDAGMYARPLLDLTLSLQMLHGWCFASESEKRKMLGEDTAHGAGVGTIPEREDALEARGVLVIMRAMPRSTMPDGSECKSGTRLTKVLTNEREQMAARLEYGRRLAERRKREPKATRPRRRLHEPRQRMPIEKLLAGISRPAKPWRPRPLTPAEKGALRATDYEAARKRALENAAIEFSKPEWQIPSPPREEDPPEGGA